MTKFLTHLFVEALRCAGITCSVSNGRKMIIGEPEGNVNSPDLKVGE